MENYLRRINGFSTPFFGISWEIIDSERTVIKDFAISLKNRRILRSGHKIIDFNSTTDSIRILRALIVDTMKKLSEKSKSYVVLQTLHDLTIEYNNFLDDYKISKDINSVIKISSEVIEITLAFRNKFSEFLKGLCEKHEIEIPNSLF